MKHLFPKGAHISAHILLVLVFLTATQLHAQTKGCEAQAAEEEGMHSHHDPTLRNLFSQTSAKPQAFTCNADAHSFFRCNGGTRVLIPANSFIHHDGSSVHGKVQLHITEVTRKGDLVLSNLPTISDGEMLETGGVIRVEAFQDGHPLSLAQEVDLYVQFPGGDEDDMQLFDGAYDGNDRMNWTTQEGVLKDESGLDENRFRFYENEFGDGDWEYETYSGFWDIDIPRFMDYGLLSLKTLRFADGKHTLESYLKEKILQDYSCSGMDSLNCQAYLRLSGTFMSVSYKSGWNPCYKRALPEIMQAIPVDTAGMGPYETYIPFSFNPDIPRRDKHDNKFLSIVDRPLNTFDPELRASIEKYLDQKAAAEFIMEAFKVRSLGWINCDRFYNEPAPRVNMITSLQNEELRGSTRAFLVFNDINAAIEGFPSPDGSTFTFSSIPEGKDARIVMLGSLNRNSSFMSTSTVTVHEGTTAANLLRPVTLEEMKATMALL